MSLPEPAGFVITCACRQNNRVPWDRILDRPTCGQCSAVLLEQGRAAPGAWAWALAIALVVLSLALAGALAGAGIGWGSGTTTALRGGAFGVGLGLCLGLIVLVIVATESGGVSDLGKMAATLAKAGRGRRW